MTQLTRSQLFKCLFLSSFQLASLVWMQQYITKTNTRKAWAKEARWCSTAQNGCAPGAAEERFYGSTTTIPKLGKGCIAFSASTKF